MAAATRHLQRPAEIIDTHHVTEISVITNNNTTVVINRAIAGDMRQARRQRSIVEEDVVVGMSSTDSQLKHQVTTMVWEARLGNLVGEVALVQGMLHFRPDGYHYWVPVDSRRSSSLVQLAPGARYRVGGQIETLRGQPDRVVVESADPIFD